MIEESVIAKFYAFKKILITGGSGFMGKVLVWKLLHSCPELDTIYILIRSKYGQDATSRKEDFFQSPIFKNFKNVTPKILEKVVFISGDVGEERLGLSDKDRNMLIDEVSVIFHGAAVLKMNVDLCTAVNVNVIGTIRMLDMAEQMKKLQAFVQISTAFCCCENSTIEEKIYPSKHDPYDIIKLTTWMDPALLENITPKILYPLPNTYVYTKRLSEALLLNYESRVPIIVARPSMVIFASKDPLPGWTDSLNGPVGMLVAGAKGVLRTSRMNMNANTDVIPVDLVINSIIILPWANPREQLLRQLSVYNITQNFFKDLTWLTMHNYFLRALDKYPLEVMLWYRVGDELASDNWFIHTFKTIFQHYLPAYLIDFILFVCGRKPFLVRVHDKIRLAEKVLTYFTKKRWLFAHNKILQLEKVLNDTDKQVFVVNMARMGQFQDYANNSTLSAKKYIFKEDANNLDKARRITRVMYVIDKLVLILRYYILWRILIFMFNLLRDIFH